MMQVINLSVNISLIFIHSATTLIYQIPLWVGQLKKIIIHFELRRDNADEMSYYGHGINTL
jgi:hypothetical protein